MKHLKLFEDKSWNLGDDKPDIISNRDVFNFDKKIHDWLDEKQEEYLEFLDNLLLGKSINTTASKWSVAGHSWERYDIVDIKEIKATGGKFYTELSVRDLTGEWYTLGSDKDTYLLTEEEVDRYRMRSQIKKFNL